MAALFAILSRVLLVFLCAPRAQWDTQLARILTDTLRRRVQVKP